jgi:Phytochelatin synthase
VINMRRLLLVFFVLAVSNALADEAVKPKLGPEASPITVDRDYFRTAPADGYWMLSAFYVPQHTSSDCSAAAAAMAVNAIRGLPARADTAIVTEDKLLKDVNDQKWSSDVVEDGPGVMFAEFAGYLGESFKAEGVDVIPVSATHLKTADQTALDQLRAALEADESSAGKEVMLVYFNQGVITGDWNGPHISPIGAYDKKNDKVLIMDVDRDWYVPYWTSTNTLLDALVKPAPADQGVLAGETGGYYVVSKK